MKISATSALFATAIDRLSALGLALDEIEAILTAVIEEVKSEESTESTESENQ